MLHNRIEERRHKVSLQATLKATSTIKNVSNKSGRFGYFMITSLCLSISWNYAYKEKEYLSLESMNSICVGSKDSHKNIREHILIIHKKQGKGCLDYHIGWFDCVVLNWANLTSIFNFDKNWQSLVIFVFWDFQRRKIFNTVLRLYAKSRTSMIMRKRGKWEVSVASYCTWAEVRERPPVQFVTVNTTQASFLPFAKRGPK